MAHWRIGALAHWRMVEQHVRSKEDVLDRIASDEVMGDGPADNPACLKTPGARAARRQANAMESSLAQIQFQSPTREGAARFSA